MDLRSQLYGQARPGRVSAVDKGHHSVEVTFEEMDGLVVEGLRMLVPPGDYSLPATGTPVLVLLVEGRLGNGYVLGCFYTENDIPPLSDAGQRAVTGGDLRLGDPRAEDKISLAPKCNANFSAIWDVLDQVFGSTSAPIVTPAPSAPDPIYTAMKSAIAAKQLSQDLPPVNVGAEKVSAK